MSARFPGFLQKRGRNKGTPFNGSEISFKGGAGTKQAFFYTCWEREENWTFKTWILQPFDSSNLIWNLMSFTSGLEIELPITERPSMWWKQIKQNTFDKKRGNKRQIKKYDLFLNTNICTVLDHVSSRLIFSLLVVSIFFLGLVCYIFCHLSLVS